MTSHFTVAIRIKKNSNGSNLETILKTNENVVQLFDRCVVHHYELPSIPKGHYVDDIRRMRDKCMKIKLVFLQDPFLSKFFNDKTRRKHGVERMHSFSFDYCFDEATSQTEIYDSLSALVLDPFIMGTNSCIIAYGQTGSGKTYTMLGTEADPGLIPRICEAILNTTSMIDTCLASFYEVYNEKVRDLLPHPITDSRKVRVREHPLYGPYVSGLSWHPISSIDDITLFLKTGCKARSCGLTNMHNCSSRSHAIFTIVKKQATIGQNDVFGTKLCLVDLAGSEKPKHQSTRDQVKEGAHINKSLATLGNVILSLGSNKNKDCPSERYIPYRNSTLTWLLKDSIGGTARTVMIGSKITAVSSSPDYYLETLNTLRYSCKAKQIVQKPYYFTERAFSTQTLITDLQLEIKRLKLLVEQKSSSNELNDNVGTECLIQECENSRSQQFNDSNKSVISRSSMTSPVENLSPQNFNMFPESKPNDDDSAKGLIIEHYKNKIGDLEKELEGYRSILNEPSNQDETVNDEVTFTSPRPLKFKLEKKIEVLECQVNERKNRLLREEYQEDHKNNNHQTVEEAWWTDYVELENSPLNHSWIAVNFGETDRPHRFAYSVPISLKKASSPHTLLSQTLYPKSLKDANRPAFAFLKKQSLSDSQILNKTGIQAKQPKKSILKESMEDKETKKFEKSFQDRLEKSLQGSDSKDMSKKNSDAPSYYDDDPSSWIDEPDVKPSVDKGDDMTSSHSESEQFTIPVFKHGGFSQSFTHHPKESSKFVKTKLSQSFSIKQKTSAADKPKFNYLKRYDSSPTSDSWSIDESKNISIPNITDTANNNYSNKVPVVEYGVSYHDLESSSDHGHPNEHKPQSLKSPVANGIPGRKSSSIYHHRFEAANKAAEILVDKCFDQLNKDQFKVSPEISSQSSQLPAKHLTNGTGNSSFHEKKIVEAKPKSFSLSDAYKNVTNNSIQLSDESGSEISDIGQSYKHVNFDPLNTSSATPYGSSFSSQSLVNKEVDHFSPTNFWKQNFKLNFEDDEENDNQSGSNSGNDRSRKVKKVVRARAELRRLKHGSNSSSGSEHSPRVTKQSELPGMKKDEKSGFYYDEDAISDMASLNGDSVEVESDKEEKIKNALLQSNVFYSSFTQNKADEDEESVAEEINGDIGTGQGNQALSSENSDYGDEWLSTPAHPKKRLSFSLANNDNSLSRNPFLNISTKSETSLKLDNLNQFDSRSVWSHSDTGRRLTFPSHTIKEDFVESDMASIDNGMLLASSPSKEALIINVKLIQRNGKLGEVPHSSNGPAHQCESVHSDADARQELRNAFHDLSNSNSYENDNFNPHDPFNVTEVITRKLLFESSGLNEKEKFHQPVLKDINSKATDNLLKPEDPKEITRSCESPALSHSFSSDFESDSTSHEQTPSRSSELETKSPLKHLPPLLDVHVLKPIETGLVQWVLFDPLIRQSSVTGLPKSLNIMQVKDVTCFGNAANDDPDNTKSEERKASWAWTESHKSTRTLARQKFFEAITVQEIVSEETVNETDPKIFEDKTTADKNVVEKPALTSTKSLSISNGKDKMEFKNNYSSSLKIHPKLFTSMEIEHYEPEYFSPESKPILQLRDDAKYSADGVLKKIEDNLKEVRENGHFVHKSTICERSMISSMPIKTTVDETSSKKMEFSNPSGNIISATKKESWQNSKSDKILNNQFNSNSSSDNKREMSKGSKDEMDVNHSVEKNKSNSHSMEKHVDNLQEVKGNYDNKNSNDDIHFKQTTESKPLLLRQNDSKIHILEKNDDSNLLYMDDQLFQHGGHQHCNVHSASVIEDGSGDMSNFSNQIDEKSKSFSKNVNCQLTQHSHDISGIGSELADIFSGRQLNRVAMTENGILSNAKQPPSAVPARSALDTLMSSGSSHNHSSINHDTQDYAQSKEHKRNQEVHGTVIEPFFDSQADSNKKIPVSNKPVHSLKKVDSHLEDRYHEIPAEHPARADIFSGRQLNRVAVTQSGNKDTPNKSSHETLAQSALNNQTSFEPSQNHISDFDDLLDHELSKSYHVWKDNPLNSFSISQNANTDVLTLRKVDSQLKDKQHQPAPGAKLQIENVPGLDETSQDNLPNGSIHNAIELVEELQCQPQVDHDIFAGRKLNSTVVENIRKSDNGSGQTHNTVPAQNALDILLSSDDQQATHTMKPSKEKKKMNNNTSIDGDLKKALGFHNTTETVLQPVKPFIHGLMKDHNYLSEEAKHLFIHEEQQFDNISLNSNSGRVIMDNPAKDDFGSELASDVNPKASSFNEGHSIPKDNKIDPNAVQGGVQDIFAGRHLQRISYVQLDSNSLSNLSMENKILEKKNEDVLIKDVVFVHNEPYHLILGTQTPVVDKSSSIAVSKDALGKPSITVKNRTDETDIFADRELQRTNQRKDMGKTTDLNAIGSHSKKQSGTTHQTYQDNLQSILTIGLINKIVPKSCEHKTDMPKNSNERSRNYETTFNSDTRTQFDNQKTGLKEQKNINLPAGESGGGIGTVALHHIVPNVIHSSPGLNHMEKHDQSTDSSQKWNLQRKPAASNSQAKSPDLNLLVDATEQYFSFLRQFLPLPITGNHDIKKQADMKDVMLSKLVNDNSLQSYMENLQKLLPFGLVPASEPTMTEIEPTKRLKKTKKNKGDEEKIRKMFFVNKAVVDDSTPQELLKSNEWVTDSVSQKSTEIETGKPIARTQVGNDEQFEIINRLPNSQLLKEKQIDEDLPSFKESSYFENLSKICPFPFASTSTYTRSNTDTNKQKDSGSNPFVSSGVTSRSGENSQLHKDAPKNQNNSTKSCTEAEEGILNVTYINGVPHIQLQLNSETEEYDEQFDLSIHSDDEGDEQNSDKEFQNDKDMEGFDNLEDMPSNHIDLDDADPDEILYYFDEKEENIVDPSLKMPISQSLDFDKIDEDLPLSNRLSESYPTISESKFKPGLSHISGSSASRDSLKLDFKDYFNNQDMHFDEDEDSDTIRKKSVSWSDLSGGLPLEHGPDTGSQHSSPLRPIIKRGSVTVEPSNGVEPKNGSFRESLRQKFKDDSNAQFSNLHDSVMFSRSALNLSSSPLRHAYVQTDPSPITRSVSTLTLNVVEDEKQFLQSSFTRDARSNFSHVPQSNFSRDPSPSPSISMEHLKRYQTKSLLHDLMSLVQERDALLESMNSDLSEWKQPKRSYRKDHSTHYMNDQWWKLWRIKNDLDKRIEEMFAKVKTHQLSELPYQHITWLNVPHSALLTCSLQSANPVENVNDSRVIPCSKLHLTPLDYEKKLANLRRTLVTTSSELKQNASYPELQIFTPTYTRANGNNDFRFGKTNSNSNWTNERKRNVFNLYDESPESILKEAQHVRQFSQDILRETRESLNMPHINMASSFKITPTRPKYFNENSREEKEIDNEIQTLRDQYRINQLVANSKF